MEIKRPIGNVLGATAAAATLDADGVALQYTITPDNTADPIVPLLGPIPYGKTRSLTWVNSQAEVRQLRTIGAVATPEVIAPSRRYRIEIGNSEDLYESAYPGRRIFAYTAPAVLSGNAVTDRANVNTVLINKINAHAGIDVVATPVHTFAYTLGDVAAPVVGEVLTQAASGVTMTVIGHTLTGGGFAGANAVGVLWVAEVSDQATLDVAVARVLTGGTSGSLMTATVGAMDMAQGIAIRDNAGYFISRDGRKGISSVQATQGFADTQFVTSVAGVYARGIGNVYLQLATRYDHARMDALAGDMEYELIRNGAFLATINYRKYIIEVEDGDQDTLALNKISNVTHYYLWVDEAAGALVAFHNALVAVVLL